MAIDNVISLFLFYHFRTLPFEWWSLQIPAHKFQKFPAYNFNFIRRCTPSQILLKVFAKFLGIPIPLATRALPRFLDL